MQNLHKKSYKNSTNNTLENCEKLYYNENALFKKRKFKFKGAFLMLKLNEICEKFSKKTENFIKHVGEGARCTINLHKNCSRWE